MRQWPVARVLTILLVLSGCSEPKAPIPVQPDNYLAIARGKIAVEGGLIEISIPPDERFDAVTVTPGAKVTKGTVLGTLDSRGANLALAEARAEYHQAVVQVAGLEQRLAGAELLAKRTRQAAQAGAIEEQQADDAELAVSQLKSEIATAKTGIELVTVRQHQAELALELRTIKAPVDGEVIKVSAQQGARLGESAAFVLLSAKPLQVQAEVNESFVGRLKEGVKAAVTLESTPDAMPLNAHVVRIGRVVESGAGSETQPAGRVVEVILDFDQPQSAGSLLVGQNVMVKFHE